MASEGQRGSQAEGERRGFLDRHWDRFRRQEVDDPVDERTEGYWDRFKRQQVDDPVDARRDRDRGRG
jgi:hypothetical protein